MTAGRRVLAIASGGGHWIQLYRMRPAWSGCEVTYASTTPCLETGLMEDAHARSEAVPRYCLLPEANRWHKVRMLGLLAAVALVVLRTRPHVVVTTGAAHGYFALRIAKLLGARTVWIDSIANASEMSLSGQLARPYADHWMTQWPDIARPEGPDFQGSVL